MCTYTCKACWPSLVTDKRLPACLLACACSELAQQPSKLPDFITFRLHVRGVRQQQEDLLVVLPAQVADLYACVTDWGFSLPQADQVRLCAAGQGRA